MKKTIALFALAIGMAVTTNAQYANTTIKVGQKAPELAYANPEGKVIKLSEINKGSYVLLDFWASWCGPCRRASPSVVALYNDYSQKKFKDAKNGFTVVSVSLDQTKDAWVTAIKKDNLLWKNHMSDLGGWQSKAAATYGVQYIPQCFLLDPKGNVLGAYNTVEEAKAELEKYLK